MPVAQNPDVIVTFLNVPLAPVPVGQLATVVTVTSPAEMTPAMIHDVAVLTAYVCGLVHNGDEMAAQRATSAAVDCSAPFVHSSMPTSMMAKQSGNRTAEIMANSTVVVPRRCLTNCRIVSYRFTEASPRSIP